MGVAAVLAVPTAAAASTLSTTSSPHVSPALLANCEPNPSSCGYPDADNTGVNPAVRLQQVPNQVSSGTGWHFDSRGYVVVNGNGANLTNLLIPYPVSITASNVTLNNVEIANGIVTAGPRRGTRIAPSAATSSTIIAVTLRHATGVTIEHTTISGLSANGAGLAAGIKDIYGDAAGLTVANDNISDTSIGIQVDQGQIQGNWVHSEAPADGQVAGIESNGRSTSQLTIEGNTVLVGANKSYAIGLFPDSGAQQNRTVDGNLLAGGNYTIYGGEPAKGPASSNVVITNNRVSRAFYLKGGLYGPATAFNPASSGNSWTDNIWDDTTLPIPAP
jgi:hypothetical protein